MCTATSRHCALWAAFACQAASRQAICLCFNAFPLSVRLVFTVAGECHVFCPLAFPALWWPRCGESHTAEGAHVLWPVCSSWLGVAALPGVGGYKTAPHLVTSSTIFLSVPAAMLEIESEAFWSKWAEARGQCGRLFSSVPGGRRSRLTCLGGLVLSRAFRLSVAVWRDCRLWPHPRVTRCLEALGPCCAT